MPKRIVVVEHDPAWKLEFEAEGKRIRRAFGDLIVNLHHIGSTAIPGIVAKPIIDILMEVADMDTFDKKISIMEELGYEQKCRFGIQGRRYFRKNDASGERTHQVHAFEVGNPDIERHIVFRDYMIAHPDEAQLYSELKQRLVRAYANDTQSYLDGKDPFIKEHEARAIAWKPAKKMDEPQADETKERI